MGQSESLRAKQETARAIHMQARKGEEAKMDCQDSGLGVCDNNHTGSTEKQQQMRLLSYAEESGKLGVDMWTAGHPDTGGPQAEEWAPRGVASPGSGFRGRRQVNPSVEGRRKRDGEEGQAEKGEKCCLNTGGRGGDTQKSTDLSSICRRLWQSPQGILRRQPAEKRAGVPMGGAHSPTGHKAGLSPLPTSVGTGEAGFT